MPEGRHGHNVRSHRRGGRRRHWAIAPWIIFTAVGVLAASGLTAGYVVMASAGCSGNPVPVTVLASADIANTLGTVAGRWAQTKPGVHGKCAAVEVLTAESAQVAAGLGAPEWDEKANGPRPHVWVPESTVWLKRAAINDTAAKVLPDLQPSLARSPTVVAMPRPMADALQWPQTKVAWRDLVKQFAGGTGASGWARYGHPEWGPFRLGMSDPAKSTAGLHALIAVTDANDDGDVSIQERSDVVTLNSAVTEYAAGTAELISKLGQLDAEGAAKVLPYLSAFPALERDVLLYNGNSPKVPLAAIYPTDGSSDADHPYLTLDAPWSDRLHRDVANAFLDYAKGDAGRREFAKAGFRDANRAPGTGLTESNGLVPQLTTLPRAVPEPGSVAMTLATWTAVRRPTNLLFVVDTSGSMDDQVAGTGKTRMVIAREAAGAAIGMLGNDAHVGLWRFATELNGNQDWDQLVPIGPIRAADRRLALLKEIGDLEAGGDTGLYDTALAAFREVKRTYRDGATHLVVLLTDGANDDSGSIGLDQLEAQLKQLQDDSKPVRFIAIGFGQQADMPALRRIAAATGAQAFQARYETEIHTVLIDALFGR